MAGAVCREEEIAKVCGHRPQTVDKLVCGAGVRCHARALLAAEGDEAGGDEGDCEVAAAKLVERLRGVE